MKTRFINKAMALLLCATIVLFSGNSVFAANNESSTQMFDFNSLDENAISNGETIVIDLGDGVILTVNPDFNPKQPRINKTQSVYLSATSWTPFADDNPLFRTNLNVVNRLGNPRRIDARITINPWSTTPIFRMLVNIPVATGGLRVSFDAAPYIVELRAHSAGMYTINVNDWY